MKVFSVLLTVDARAPLESAPVPAINVVDGLLVVVVVVAPSSTALWPVFSADNSDSGILMLTRPGIGVSAVGSEDAGEIEVALVSVDVAKAAAAPGPPAVTFFCGNIVVVF